MKKTLTTLDTIAIVKWNAELTDDKKLAIPMKVRFHLKKAISKMQSNVELFDTFRNEELRKIQSNYINSQKTTEVTENVVDNDGNPVLDDNGLQLTETVYKINDEYMKDYQAEIDDLNNRLNEMLMKTNTYEYNGVNIENMVDNLPENTPLTFEDLDMLDAILNEE